MRTGKVADMLGVDQKTITNWTDRSEFQRFYSREALGQGRTMTRDYSEQDVVVLNTIRSERQKNTDWETIAKLLDEGMRDTDLPPSALLVESSAPVVQYGKLQALVAERDAAIERAERAEAQNAELQNEIRRLNREIGKMEAQVDMLKQQNKTSDEK
jgi:DNA-binding transcriptional MerR regulator